MVDIERISVKQAREKAHQALLVCAYENEAKQRMFNLDGSISLANFDLGWLADASAVGQAAKYQAEGFSNVKVLQGGVEAWKAAGYPMTA
jgi:hypothetical protein